jgi:predicted nucleic acid-binding protein
VGPVAKPESPLFVRRQVHDANIVATMLAHGERRLLTFNDAVFRRFAPLIEVVVP